MPAGATMAESHLATTWFLQPEQPACTELWVARMCPLLMQGCFPEPDKDPVIQIASMVTNQGETTPVVRNVMTLDTCAAIIGSEVMSFKTEQELLKVCHSSQHDMEPVETSCLVVVHIQNLLRQSTVSRYLCCRMLLHCVNVCGYKIPCKACCTLRCRGGEIW